MTSFDLSEILYPSIKCLLPVHSQKDFLGVKACIQVDAHPTDACSAVLSNYRACYNAEVVELLSHSYSVRTVDLCGEFAVGNDTLDKHGNSLVVQGVLVGGSSGGTAMSVHERWVTLGLGTDTGGSIRDVTYCYDHMWGFKPSYGLISREGVIPLCQALDCVSLLAEEDAFARIYSAMLILIRGRKDGTLVGSRAICDKLMMTQWEPRVLILDDLEKSVLVDSKLSKYPKGRSPISTHLLNLIERWYLLFTGMYLVSNLNRYKLMDYSAISHPVLTSSMKHIRESDPMSKLGHDARVRYSWGLVCFHSAVIRSLVLRYHDMLVKLIRDRLCEYDLIIHNVRGPSSQYLFVSNLLGTASCSVGKVCYTSVSSLSDLRLLKFLRRNVYRQD